jgi:hypothetical protein
LRTPGGVVEVLEPKGDEELGGEEEEVEEGERAWWGVGEV